MGVAHSFYQIAKSYTPTDDIIIGHDAVKVCSGSTWTLRKSILLVSVIQLKSLFRFKFDMRLTFASGIGYCQIRKNGVIIGTEQTNNTTGFTTHTEDIASANWVKGDSIELWVKDTSTGDVEVKNFRLCGIPSEFEKDV